MREKLLDEEMLEARGVCVAKIIVDSSNWRGGFPKGILPTAALTLATQLGLTPSTTFLTSVMCWKES